MKFLKFLARLLAGIVTRSQTKVPGTSPTLPRQADGDDPNATEQARTQALVATLESIFVDAINRSSIRRNLDMAVPLPAARGFRVTRLSGDAAEGLSGPAAAVKPAVWIGKKGNLRSLWMILGDPEGPSPLFGDLFFVTPGSGSIRTRFVA